MGKFKTPAGTVMHPPKEIIDKVIANSMRKARRGIRKVVTRKIARNMLRNKIKSNRISEAWSNLEKKYGPGFYKKGW